MAYTNDSGYKLVTQQLVIKYNAYMLMFNFSVEAMLNFFLDSTLWNGRVKFILHGIVFF